MGKEVVICIIIIIMVIVGNYLTQQYTIESIQIMTDGLSQLREELTKEEKEEKKIQEKTENIKSDWMKMHDKLAYYIEHDELEKVETDLVSLRGNITVKEYETGVSELDKCVFVLEHIKDKQTLRLVNIF